MVHRSRYEAADPCVDLSGDVIVDRRDVRGGRGRARRLRRLKGYETSVFATCECSTDSFDRLAGRGALRIIPTMPTARSIACPISTPDMPRSGYFAASAAPRSAVSIGSPATTRATRREMSSESASRDTDCSSAVLHSSSTDYPQARAAPGTRSPPEAGKSAKPYVPLRPRPTLLWRYRRSCGASSTVPPR